MIFDYSNGAFANAMMAGIALATATVAAFLTWRWGWKAWPWVLLSALTMPIVLSAIRTSILYQIAMRDDVAGGFVVHLNLLIFAIGLPSALVGLGAALVFRRARL
jgi:hypothetical protein